MAPTVLATLEAEDLRTEDCLSSGVQDQPGQQEGGKKKEKRNDSGGEKRVKEATSFWPGRRRFFHQDRMRRRGPLSGSVSDSLATSLPNKQGNLSPKAQKEGGLRVLPRLALPETRSTGA